MSAFQIVLLVVGIITIQALVWFIIIRQLKMKTETLKSKMVQLLSSTNSTVISEPEAALYRGADIRFGNVKGNGIICLTANSLLFEKLTGQKIAIDLADIVEATVEDSFKGKTSFATGGRHLVVRTKDGNRTGFLLKDAEEWSRKINSL